MKDLGHLCPSLPCSDRISFILARLGILYAMTESTKIHEEGRMWDPRECAALQPPGSRSPPLAGNYYLLLSSSTPTHRRLSSCHKKRGDPSFMQISLAKITHLAHSRAFITSVKLSGEPGQRKSVSFNPQILIEMTERRSYRGHFRAAGRPTFIFFEGPEMICVSSGG